SNVFICCSLYLSFSASCSIYFFFLSRPGNRPDLHSFPTRRSSDLSTNDGELNGNQSFSAKILPSKVNNLFIKDITEMWNVVDHRSEEHTSELQSRFDLVCRLLLEKKKNQVQQI